MPKPANDVRDLRQIALRPEDMTSEFAMKRAENRIARHMGEDIAQGARWMLRRLRMRLHRR